MPSVDGNRERWNTYDWDEKGDEWSEVWGGTENLWGSTLAPRLRQFLPAGTILEIAPGFGRITNYLKDQCEKLVLVDVAERCIQECHERFRGLDHLEYHVNDGKTLPMVEDESIDFAFSFDSLVHCEYDVLEAYAVELNRVLKPDGLAFFHHSNIGAFANVESGGLSISNDHWRGESMSAEKMRNEICPNTGLSCIAQELITWGGENLVDAFSVLTRRGSRWDRGCEVKANPRFMDHALAVAGSTKFFTFEPNPELPKAQAMVQENVKKLRKQVGKIVRSETAERAAEAVRNLPQTLPEVIPSTLPKNLPSLPSPPSLQEIPKKKAVGVFASLAAVVLAGGYIGKAAQARKNEWTGSSEDPSASADEDFEEADFLDDVDEMGDDETSQV